ncbi:MAG: sensor histidine kinase [Solirubrobacterales bacterium]
MRSALILIGAAGFAFGVVLGVLIHTSSGDTDSPTIDTILTLIPAWSFIGTGLFAWWRRPNNRCGMLMTLVGFTWLLIPLTMFDNLAVFIVGGVTQNYPWVLLIALLLVFPTGRFERPWHRGFLAFTFFDATILPLVTMTFQGKDLSQYGCTDCPLNPIQLHHSEDIANVLDAITSLAAVGLLVTLVVILVRRYRGYGPAARAAIQPVLFAGTVTIGSLVLLVSLQSVGINDSLGQAIFIVTVLALSFVPFAFLLGLLRSRFTSAGAISELIAALGETSLQSSDIRDAMAEALDDTSLQFAYWLPERELYVDEQGLPIELPDDDPRCGCTTVEHDGELIASIIYDASIEDNQQLIRATGSAAALALRNQRLEAELRARVEELRASRTRIVQASDTARRELERNLHDGAQQHLVSMALTLRMAQNKLDDDPGAARELLLQASTDLAEATTELRELARGIHPAILTDRGLGAALEALASRSQVPVELGEVPEERLPAPVESAAYFVVAEALTNVARYSNANFARVDVQRVNGTAMIEVSDDGVGGASIDLGTGLRGLQDRVAALDGRLVVSSPLGKGTTVTAEMPCVR